MKSLNNFPEYIETVEAVRRLNLELDSISKRRGEIETRLLRPKVLTDAENWKRFKSPNGKWEIDDDAQLREELNHLRERETFLNRAARIAKLELDQARDRASAEIVREVRPQYINELRIILSALKTLTEANERLEALRDGLDAQNVSVALLPPAVFSCGAWNDPWGSGMVVNYRQYIAQHFPELTTEAPSGQKTKAVAGKRA